MERGRPVRQLIIGTPVSDPASSSRYDQLAKADAFERAKNGIHSSPRRPQNKMPHHHCSYLFSASDKKTHLD